MSTTRRPDLILNDPVAAHARTDFTTLGRDWTVGEALDHMRTSPPPGRIIYFYVTDADGRLAGVVPTRRLLLSQPDARIADVMIRHVIAVPATATVLEACEFFTLHRLLAFPVVDADRRVVGLIDVELYTEELVGGDADDAPRPGDDVFDIIGVHLTAASQAPARAFRGRFPWLVCNITAGLLAAVLAGVYQDVLTWRDAVLALFIPVVLALSESVSIQSVTLAVGRLRTGAGQRALRDGLREAATGVLLGVASAVLVAGAAAAWLGDLAVGAILLATITAGVAGSAVIGYAGPTLLHRLKWNPQVAAGPVCLAAADMLTLAVYFNLARLAA